MTNDWSGPVAGERDHKSGLVFYLGAPVASVGNDRFTARMTGTMTPTVDGEHTFSLIEVDGARLLVNGQVVIDAVDDRPDRGHAYFSMGSIELRATVQLTAGEPVDIVVEFASKAGSGVKGVTVGHKPPVAADLMEQAVAAAAAAEVAVVIVGTSSEWETEGNDRETMDLPGDQVELIRAVCAANPRTAVVVNAGSAVDLSWTDVPAATLYGWLGGQEMATALVDVLTGVTEPGGRLPITMPRSIEHTPAFGNFPGEANVTNYAEATLVGYRWYDTRKLPVEYPFGYGLSYTSFDWGEPTVTSTGDASCTVQIQVTNTGDRTGSEVVQVYIAPPASAFAKAAKQLAGVAKVELAPGQAATASIELNPRSFAFWDPANQDHVQAHKRLAGSGGGVPLSGGSSDATVAGWYVEAGAYQLCVARSASDVVAQVPFEVEVPLGPLTGDASLP